MTQRRKLRACVIFLAAIHGIIAAAGFFAPYAPDQQDRDHPYLPPMAIHWIDPSGHFHFRPFCYARKLREVTFDQYEDDRSSTIPLQFFVRGPVYHLFGILPLRLHLIGTAGARAYFLGTDAFGRDQLSRLLYGGQLSLLAGLLGTAVTLFLGSLIGVTAGFYGGWPDDILMRVAELFLALPWLYLLLALRAFLPLSVDPLQAFLLVVVVIGAVGWARPARLVRSVVLSVKEREFVLAARGFGASNSYLLRRHIFPEIASVLMTQATLLIPQFVIAEMTLSFLSLGVPEPAASWGNLLSNLQQYSVLVSYWWMYIPALAIVPFFLGYLGLASALQERSGAYKIDG